MPFGEGPRIWSGRWVAPQEMKMMLLALMTRVDVDFIGTEYGNVPAARLIFATVSMGLLMRL